MPVSHFFLAAFIAQHVGEVGGDMVKSSMSGIKTWHNINGAPWEGEYRWVELARHTANKEGTAFRREQRGPVTIKHMIALRAALDLSIPFHAAIWATAMAAFWGCRHLGKLTIPSLDKFDPKLHVTCSARTKRINTNGAIATSVPLPWTKSIRDRGGKLILTARDDDLCPNKAFANHVCVNKDTPADAPLFAFMAKDGNWSPMTKDWFMRFCNAAWQKAALLRDFGHSFRIGGSTELLLAGVPCEIVAALGGWTSLAFLLY
ncbi:hypothetical protein MVEN_01130900 [Mycena venus]|uniref:DNA breaking-rejoining enzyme n=1 Tax=Mycena venus TaxID=2733690 RepID=A0A8H6Y8L8_9AGAR|nr:hypothetical protein MVEN_01130900 [Mycena venus]